MGAAAPQPLRAQHGIGFRSGFTEGLGIPPHGKVDLDYGSSLTTAGNTRVYAAGEFVAHIPLASRLGVRLHLNSYTWIASSGAVTAGREDVGIGTATNLVQGHGWRPMIGLLSRVDVPTGTLPNRERQWRPSAKAILAWQLPAGVALASNLGVALPSDHGERFVQQFGSVWVSRSVTRRVGAFAEVVLHNRETRTGPSTSLLRGGLTLLATGAHHLDVHASTQLGGTRPRRVFGVGLKERF